MGFYKDLTDILNATQVYYEPTSIIGRRASVPTESIPVSIIEPEAEIIVPDEIIPESTADEDIIDAVEPDVPSKGKWEVIENVVQDDWSDKTFRNMLLDAQLLHESGFNSEAVSHDKHGNPIAYGIAQFIPSTWEWAKDMGWIGSDASSFNVKDSIRAQQALMRNLWNLDIISSAPTQDDRIDRMLAGYNAGSGNLKDALLLAKEKGGHWKDYLPKPGETLPYIKRIREQINTYKNDKSYKFKYDRSQLKI